MSFSSSESGFSTLGAGLEVCTALEVFFCWVVLVTAVLFCCFVFEPDVLFCCVVLAPFVTFCWVVVAPLRGVGPELVFTTVNRKVFVSSIAGLNNVTTKITKRD
jgi:hypothetical protein